MLTYFPNRTKKGTQFSLVFHLFLLFIQTERRDGTIPFLWNRTMHSIPLERNHAFHSSGTKPCIPFHAVPEPNTITSSMHYNSFLLGVVGSYEHERSQPQDKRPRVVEAQDFRVGAKIFMEFMLGASFTRSNLHNFCEYIYYFVHEFQHDRFLPTIYLTLVLSVKYV
jgi:hypothetical protein